MAKTIKMGLRPELDTTTMSVTMNVKDGDEILSHRYYVFDDYPVEIQQQLMLHGLSTALQQRTSQFKEDPLGKLMAMDEVSARWLEGEWAKERKVGPRILPAIIEVLHSIKVAKGFKVSVAEVQAAWNSLDEDQRSVLREKYKDEVAQVEAKRAKAPATGVLDDML